MRSTRRVLLTTSLVGLMALGGSPFHAVEFADATPEVVDAEVDLAPGDLARTADGRRSDPVAAPITFTGLWVELDTPVEEIRVRTSPDGESWEDWSTVGLVDEEDGPDPGSEEARDADGAAHVTDLVIAEESTHFQLELDETVGDVRVVVADSSGANDSLWVRTKRVLTRTAVPAAEAAEAADLPDWVVSRREWGADEANSRTGSSASAGVRSVVVHHTASNNDYSPEGAANQIRIFQRYHIMSQGWSDIGYNALVDRFGRIYEGRKGGIDRAIIGAHAAGHNTGSFGVAVIGDFSAQRAPQVAIDALSKVIGYKASIHGFDPAGTVESDGRSRPVVIGHQDVGRTACPGRVMEQLPQVRTSARLTAVANGSPFDDIHAGNTHGVAVLTLHQEGIVNGCAPRRFCPGSDLTRGQAASLIARALELPAGDGSRYVDVRQGTTHDGAIGAVADRGIVTGYDDGSFRPDDPLTREQMASFLARAMELAPVLEQRFADVSPGSVHGGNVHALSEARITQGCTDTTFCPRDHVTRAQMASFVDRMRTRPVR